ncbi:NUDIX domain-containing protein [Patescibacteria group bacterium]|nr:NUDIX domain-containing protein [Patescibacteria group bacterium]
MGEGKKEKVTREFSSGGVVYRKKGKRIFWLVRKTAASKLFPRQYWMLPKGRIDDTGHDTPGPMASGRIKADEESLQKAAVKEVAEEGGITAKVIKKMETIKYSFTHPRQGKVLKFVTFYLMIWKKDLPEGFDKETAEIAWLSYEEAYKKLSFWQERDVIKKAKELL